MRVSNPSGKTCEFNRKNHQFTIIETGQKLSSVSKVGNHFFPKFNAKKVAAMCQKKLEYSGMLPDDIVNLWSREGDLSREEGTCVHDMITAYIHDTGMAEPISMRCVRMFKCAVEIIVAYRKNYNIIGSEVLVFSESLGIAGFIDLLLQRNSDFLIIDFKTNKEMKKDNRYEKGDKPLQKLDSCNLNQYMVQCNLLKKIFLHEGYYNASSCRPLLIHLQEYGDAVKYPVKVMDKEINKMIEMWKG